MGTTEGSRHKSDNRVEVGGKSGNQAITKVQVRSIHHSEIMTAHREIKDDTNKWNDIEYLWIGTLNIVMMSIPTKVIY